LTSGIGIDEADKKKGITTMPAKLEHMCPSYELWDQWFGSKQKYHPSNVQCNARPDFDDEEEENENRPAKMPDVVEWQLVSSLAEGWGWCPAQPVKLIAISGFNGTKATTGASPKSKSRHTGSTGSSCRCREHFALHGSKSGQV
jgi:hypothetical protein